jgi:hypothetical protein
LKQNGIVKAKEYPLTFGYQTTSTQKNLHPTAARELNLKPKRKTTTQLEQREIKQAAETTNNLLEQPKLTTQKRRKGLKSQL